jgi:SAM-dependent methyltransferase
VQESLFSAHRDLESRHWWFRGRRRAIRLLGSQLLPPGGVVVDVGCGTGADIAAFPPEYARHGIDVSESAITLARAAHPGVAFEVGAVPTAGQEAVARADLVLLCDVLEHVPDDGALLGALTAWMKPGAHLLLTVPSDPSLWSPHDEVYGHHRRYTRERLASAWAECPVDVRLLAPFNRRLYPLARLARSVSARLGRGCGREGSDLTLPWAPVNAALERIFAGEAVGLAAVLHAGRREPAGRGVSLLAVLRRIDGRRAVPGVGVTEPEVTGG